jgi:GNAT superfamily N-acetyltransferase
VIEARCVSLTSNAEHRHGNRSEAEPLVFVGCAEVGDKQFDHFYHDVLEPAFPAAELNDIETLRAQYLNSATSSPGTIALLRGEPVGGALAEFHAPTGIMLLAYLAVRADLRGKGLGSALLNEVLPRWREAMRPTAILAEVENPRYHVAGPYGDPEARLRFYGQIGATLLPLAYFQPSIGPGLNRVRGMFLICLDSDKDTILGASLQLFLDDYVAFCEGNRVITTDSEYLTLRAQVRAWPGDRIPLWPLSRAPEVQVVHGQDDYQR